ncbi:MAG: DNA repair protein RecO [Rickettsiales bacterium]|jgi:DNA repair protein RecO (recombination protein O)|nr:DNA repair protein RecO [Rickettsiales bacterium]
MKLESAGIIIELKPFAERDSVGRVFTSDFGILGGIFKAGQIAKTKPLLGQFGRIAWNARLDSHLGSFHFENEKNLIAGFFSSTEKLGRVNACFALLSLLLPEREKYAKLYGETIKMLAMPEMENYLMWELSLLAELGYGLSLDKCGNCGTSENLKYISPKTGRTICEKCGAPHRNKLFELPIDLNTTKYFLEQISELPASRRRLSPES